MATESRPAAPDYLALFLVAITMINLDGVVTTLNQTRETLAQDTSTLSAFFVFALPISLYLIARYARISNMGDIFGLFVLFFAFYLIGSGVHSLVGGDIQVADLIVVKIYVFAAVFTSAVYFWAAQLSEKALVDVLRFSKALLLIVALSTIFSPILPFYQSTSLERAGGFFIGQNDAAFAALFCLVLVAAYPARSRLLTLAQGGVAFTALIMTFSRTGILIFLLLSLLFLFDRPSIKAVVVFVIGMTLLSSALWLVFEHDLFGLNWAQRQRLADVVGILTGEAPQKTAGARGILFDVGLRKIAEVFPWGVGIGKFHSMEYGIRAHGSGAWQGVHNTYLMILGEAGLAAFVAFLAFWARTIWKLANSSAFRTFSMGATVVMLCSMMTTHSVLNGKVSPLMLAFVMVIAARSPASRKTFFAPETAPGVPQP